MSKQLSIVATANCTAGGVPPFKQVSLLVKYVLFFILVELLFSTVYMLLLLRKGSIAVKIASTQSRCTKRV